MVLIAFSLQAQVEKYGAYVGIASFFGLAVLSLLYFAQSREVRRLREWAGRAPERLLELDSHPALLRATQPRTAPVARERTPAPVPAAAGNGVVHKLKPEQVAALAFARAAGVASPPHPPKPSVPVVVNGGSVPAVPAEAAPVAVAATAQAAAPAAVPAQAAAPPPEVPPAPVPNGRSSGDVPAPATPAARRVPAAPLRATPPPRRPAPAPSAARRHTIPPPRETSRRTIVLTVIAGVLVLGVVGFGAIRLLGGGSDTPKPHTKGSTANVVASPGPDDAATATPTPVARDTIKVTVLNGTGQQGLAGQITSQLVHKGFATTRTAFGTGTPGATLSVAMYKHGKKALAEDVAKALEIKAPVAPIDAASQAKAAGIADLTDLNKDPDVIVVVGPDKSGQ
jgi:hypothetical protein